MLEKLHKTKKGPDSKRAYIFSKKVKFYQYYSFWLSQLPLNGLEILQEKIKEIKAELKAQMAFDGQSTDTNMKRSEMGRNGKMVEEIHDANKHTQHGGS